MKKPRKPGRPRNPVSPVSLEALDVGAFTARQVADALQISLMQVYRLADTGKLPCIVIPNMGHGQQRDRRFPRDETLAVIKKWREGGEASAAGLSAGSAQGSADLHRSMVLEMSSQRHLQKRGGGKR